MEAQQVEPEVASAVAPLLAYAEAKLTEQEDEATEDCVPYKRIRVCFDDARQPRRILDTVDEPPSRDVVSLAAFVL
jgi:hypothetical protein